MHEHPETAASWKYECVKEVEQLPGVLKVVGDMCEQGMFIQDEHGVGRVRKPTAYLTDSVCIAEELAKRCSNDPDAIAVWRRTDDGARTGRMPGQKGPCWESVTRRVTLDLSNGILLQDFRDVHSASRSDLHFKIPDNCYRTETLFYFVREGRNWHRHVPLVGGKAKQCEVYPRPLIRSILRGLRKQLKKRIPMSALEFGPTNQEEDLDLSTVPNEDWCTFVDEVSGKALEASKVQAARAEEIDYAQRYQVWTVVDTDECYKATGKPPISTRWIDVDKGDINRPNYRSRLVVQEVRSSEIEAIFAATPPLESIRMLLSLQRSGNERDHKGRRKKVMFLDVRRAHWTAKIFRLVYVQLPDEAGVGPGKCGRLNKAMYGCRDAAACWELEITDCFTTAGFCPGIGSPVLFCNQTRDLQVTLHGDDITTLGFEDDLFWMKSMLEERYELKFGGLLGPDETDVREVSVLNRLVCYGEYATTIEADPRHVEILVNTLNLQQGKSVSSPGVSNDGGDVTPLEPSDASQYRSLVMRCNYLALDRPDIHFASKELARSMQHPTKGSWNGLKRLVRYLSGCKRLVWRYDEQPTQTCLRMYSDSDDGGCVQTRKSTSCGALYHGRLLLKFYSATQHVIALSSGESEFYAGIKAGSTLLGGISTMKDLGCDFEAVLVFDASAAKALMSRRGHGKAKHISRCFLWLQQRIHEGEIRLEKVGTAKNSADLGTKHLAGPRIQELCTEMCLQFIEGEHGMALHV